MAGLMEETRRRSGDVVNQVTRKFFLAPNSAAAERTFSQINDTFGSKQALALADMLQAALKLHCHKRLAHEPGYPGR